MKINGVDLEKLKLKMENAKLKEELKKQVDSKKPTPNTTQDIPTLGGCFNLLFTFITFN